MTDSKEKEQTPTPEEVTLHELELSLKFLEGEIFKTKQWLYEANLERSRIRVDINDAKRKIMAQRLSK